MPTTPKTKKPNQPTPDTNRPVKVRASETIKITIDGAILTFLDDLHPVYGQTLEDRANTLLRREIIRLIEDDRAVFKPQPDDAEDDE